MKEALPVSRETMKRARANVECLVEQLPRLGYQFEASALGSPFVPATDSTAAELDMLEREIGVLPLSLRIWFEEVGQVSLVGHHPDWKCGYLDQLVVEAPVDYIRSEYEGWEHDRGTEWYRGPTFQLPIAPDYLHRADVSGGPRYALDVPNPAADGLLLWEPHQTTFVNYLRIAFASAGMPGWRGNVSALYDWAVPGEGLPDALEGLAQKMLPPQ